MDEMREKSGKEQQGEIEKIDLIEFLSLIHISEPTRPY